MSAALHTQPSNPECVGTPSACLHTSTETHQSVSTSETIT